MKTINIRIKGTSPYLAGKPTIQEIMGKCKEEPQPSERFHYDEKGNKVVPFDHLHRCLINAGKFKKQAGKRGANYSKTIAAMITIQPDLIPLIAKEWNPENDLFTRPLRRKDGNRIIKTSPIIKEWALEFTIKVMDGIPVEDIKEIIEYAGIMEGLGEWRPACKGRFGKFEIEKWEVR